MRYLQRGLRLTRWLVGAVLLAAVLFSAVVTGLGISGKVRLRSELTGSMSPTIGVGDLVVYLPQHAAQARPGQVISFYRAGTPYPITHRVEQTTVTGGTVSLVTKGDANTATDSEPADFAPTATVWRVRLTIPGAGNLIAQLTGRNGVIFILSFLPLFFGLPWLERMARDYRELSVSAA